MKIKQNINNKIQDLIEVSKNNIEFEDTMPDNIGIFLDKVIKGEADKELREDIKFAKNLMKAII